MVTEQPTDGLVKDVVEQCLCTVAEIIDRNILLIGKRCTVLFNVMVYRLKTVCPDLNLSIVEYCCRPAEFVRVYAEPKL